MPAEGVDLISKPELLSFEELTELGGLFARHGLEKIRITGGEPLVRRNLPELISKLKSVGVPKIGLTTNAFLLRRDAQALHDAGCDELNISLDTLDADKFKKLSRIGALDRVLDGIEAAREVGFGRLKFNAVVIRGFNDAEIVDLASFAAQNNDIMRFIEFMPIGADTVWGPNACVPAKEMRAALNHAGTITPIVDVFGHGPSRYWQWEQQNTTSDIGFISAVTECFCDDCNRIRLTPQGGLRACLADEHEVSLKSILRGEQSDREDLLVEAINLALRGKKLEHSFVIDGTNVTKTRMNAIGG